MNNDETDTRPRRTFCWGGRNHQPLQVPVVDGEVHCSRGCTPRLVTDLDNVELCTPDGEALAAEVRVVSARLRSSKPAVADTLDAAMMRAGWLPYNTDAFPAQRETFADRVATNVCENLDGLLIGHDVFGEAWDDAGIESRRTLLCDVAGFIRDEMAAQPCASQSSAYTADEFVTTADMHEWLNATPEGDRREVTDVAGDRSITIVVDRRPRTDKT